MNRASANDWTTYELPELVAFFGWMDALCAEAIRQGLGTPWPISDRMAEGLNYWIADFDRGLTPAEALDRHRSMRMAQAPPKILATGSAGN
jgi:hypothetical protein